MEIQKYKKASDRKTQENIRLQKQNELLRKRLCENGTIIAKNKAMNEELMHDQIVNKRKEKEIKAKRARATVAKSKRKPVM